MRTVTLRREFEEENSSVLAMQLEAKTEWSSSTLTAVSTIYSFAQRLTFQIRRRYFLFHNFGMTHPFFPSSTMAAAWSIATGSFRQWFPMNQECPVICAKQLAHLHLNARRRFVRKGSIKESIFERFGRKKRFPFFVWGAGSKLRWV